MIPEKTVVSGERANLGRSIEREILNAFLATSLLLAFLLVFTGDTKFGFLALPFRQLFWQAPLAVIIGFAIITFFGSTYLQKRLSGGHLNLKNAVLWLLLLTLLYSIFINLARDLGFCLDKWTGIAEMGKSYCRPEKYMTIEHWAVAILISAMYYAAILSSALIIVNYGVFRIVRSKASG